MNGITFDQLLANATTDNVLADFFQRAMALLKNEQIVNEQIATALAKCGK